MENIKEIAQLFKNKKYSELIFFVESNYKKIPAEILNIVAVSRLLQKKDISSYKKSIEEFKKVYTQEKNQEIGKNGLINFLNSSSDFYDYLGNCNELNEANSFLRQSINFFYEAEKFFGYDAKLVSAVIRVFKRLNNLDDTLKYYSKLYENKDLNLNKLCLWIFFNNYKNYWKQKDYFFYSKLIESYAISIPEEKLQNLSKETSGKTKIGFLSSDINSSHSITFFLKTVLKFYDNDKYEITLILNNKIEDEGTKKFKNLCDFTININGLSDEESINNIRKLNLNIIFDLMGVTSLNRISLFKNRLAKIQISWLGYCNTMGIKNIDYLIADPNLICSDEEKYYSEKILYLPKIWNCHSGLNIERIENPLPFFKNKYVTFGSFNNYNKINDNVLSVWSNILSEVKGSKLILKSSTKKEIENFKDFFYKNKVLDSVQFLPTSKFFEEHIKLYNRIDISLDTFPYNGVTTSFESIWMGVPVITMRGFNFNSRCGESINKNIKMDQLISKNEQDYIFKAIDLANNPDKLLNIRKKIFNETLTSPLFDAKTFSRDFYYLIDKIN